MKIRMFLAAFACLMFSETMLVAQTPSVVQPGLNEKNADWSDEDAFLMQMLDQALEAAVRFADKGKQVSRADHSQELIAYFNSNGEFRSRREKILGSDYSRPILFKKMAGESSRINWLKGIPVPQMPEPALQANPRENLQYAKKLETAYEQMKDEARRLANSTDLAKAHQQGGDAAVKKIYEQQINQNPMIAQMGGAEKLQNMSDAERKAAASRAVAQRTAGLTPEQIQKMTPEQRKALAQNMAMQQQSTDPSREVAEAFTRELMVNADLRRRYEAMNNTEKQAYYRDFEKRYLGSENVANSNAPSGADNDALAREAREILMIEKFAADFRADLENSLAPIRSRIQSNEAIYSMRMDRLNKWTAAETAKLPEVSDSEYGPYKQGLDRVDMVRYLMTYYIDRDRIRHDRENWEAKVNAVIPAIQKLDNFVANFEKRKDLSDRLKLAVAEAMSGGYESILELNREAGFISNQAASTQYQYQCMVLKQCEDPRAEKYKSSEP